MSPSRRWLRLTCCHVLLLSALNRVPLQTVFAGDPYELRRSALPDHSRKAHCLSLTLYVFCQRKEAIKSGYTLPKVRKGLRLLLPILDLHLTRFEGGGDDMPITAFDGPGKGIVFR